MPIRISPVIAARTHAQTWTDWIKTVDVSALAGFSGPVTTLNHFRLTGPATAARLGAENSAMTYVLCDSDVSLRTRDSFGNDILMRPGGLVWSQSGCGIAHEHLPAEVGRELACLQLCVKHSPARAGANPAVMRVEPEQVPEWWGSSGDCVRVVAGSYAGHASPVPHNSQITLLDARLRCAVYFDVAPGHDTLVYVLSGFVLALSEGHTRRLESGQAFLLHNPRGTALLQLIGTGHLLILDGPAESESVRQPGGGANGIHSTLLPRTRRDELREAATVD